MKKRFDLMCSGGRSGGRPRVVEGRAPGVVVSRSPDREMADESDKLLLVYERRVDICIG